MNIDEITRDWLNVFAAVKSKGELAKSAFFRLASLDVLPAGVDPTNPEVVAALREIRVANLREWKGRT